MAVRKGDKVAYHTRSGEMRTGTVTRKTGQGMVDIRLDGSGRTVRQEGKSLSRMRSNGRRSRRSYARRNIKEKNWILPFASLTFSGERTGDDAADSILDDYREYLLRESFENTLAEVQKQKGQLFGEFKETAPEFLIYESMSPEAALFQNLRDALPTQSSRNLEIYTKRSTGEKAKVDIAVGKSAGRLAESKKQFRTEQRRERRYVESAAYKELSKVTQGRDISQFIQQQGAAVRILPDPVRTNRDQTFICGNVLDGKAYTLNTTGQMRAGSHWLTYGDLGLVMRDGILAFDPKAAKYQVKMSAQGTKLKGRGSFVDLTLQNFPKISSIRAVEIRQKGPGSAGRTYIAALGGRDSTRPFNTIPLAAEGELSPVLARAVVGDGFSTRTRGGRTVFSAEDPSMPAENEVLQQFFAGIRDSKVFTPESARTKSGYDTKLATPVGITNVGSSWVKSRGGKSGIYDPKSGTFRAQKIQGGRSAPLYPRAALPPQLPVVRIQDDEGTLRVPDNRIRPETPILFSLPLRSSARPSSADFEYALDMDRDNVFRTSEILGIRTIQMKNMTAQTIRDYFQIYAPNSPKDRDPYFSWVKERPGQFPDISVESGRRKEIFDRFCPEPKELEYLEAVRQAAAALSTVVSAGGSLRSDFDRQTDIGPAGSPLIAQVSTIYLRTGRPDLAQKVQRQQDYLGSKLRNLTYALSRLSVQYDRIAEGTAIRPYRGRPAADYSIFQNVSRLDHLIPNPEVQDFVHQALRRIEREIKYLIDIAVKRGVLVAEKKVSRKRRGSIKDRKSYTIRKALKGFTAYPLGRVPDFVESYGRRKGWSTASTKAVVAAIEGANPGLLVWGRAWQDPNVIRVVSNNISALKSQYKLPELKEFITELKQYTLPSYGKRLENLQLQSVVVQGGQLLLNRKYITSYSHLLIGLLALTAYRPSAAGSVDAQEEINSLYQVSFERMVLQLLKFVGGRDGEARMIELLLSGADTYTSATDLMGNKALADFYVQTQTLPHENQAQVARMLLEWTFESGKAALQQAFIQDRSRSDEAYNLLSYMYWRATTNMSLSDWSGGSNMVFGEAVSLYLAMDFQKPSVVGPLSEETVYGASVTQLAAILDRQARVQFVKGERKGWTPNQRLQVSKWLEDTKNKAYLKGQRRDNIATFTEREIESLITLLNRLRIGEKKFVNELRRQWSSATDRSEKVEAVDVRSLPQLARNLRETLKIAIAGGHGIEDASRMAVGAGGKPMRIDGYYTYNPLLFEVTRSEYKNVAGRNNPGKLTFGGFFRYDAKSQTASWRHQDIADRVDQIGYYAMMLYWARTAALQAKGTIRTEADLQLAWNDYWDRQTELAGEDGGQELGTGNAKVFGAAKVFVPFSYSSFTPRTFLVERKSAGGRYFLAAQTYAKSRSDLFGLMRQIKEAYYLPAMDKAAGFTSEGFYPEFSPGGARGSEETRLVEHGDFRGGKLNWVGQLGVVLDQMRPILTSLPMPQSVTTQDERTRFRAAQEWMKEKYEKGFVEGRYKSTSDPTYVADASYVASIILGVPGIERGNARWLKGTKPGDPAVSNLVKALYAARTQAAVPPGGNANLQPFRATATDASFFATTHLNAAHHRREFRNKLLTIIDQKLSRLQG